jgi:hypothetical protein
MLAVYRICMTKCVTSPPLLACNVDGHTLLWKIGNQKSAPFLSFLSLDIGNENHIGVLVINLCHNSP